MAITAAPARLSRAGAAVIAIAGNHDSHVRVSVYDDLLSAFGVTIRGDLRRAAEPVLVEPRRGGQPVAIYPLPYLEPAVDGPALSDGALQGERFTHQTVTRLALERIQQHRAAQPSRRSLLVAHTFVAGGETSDSERELTVGNVDRVSVETFDGFDYVALGHLHGSQQLASARVAYSGTPLAYSFSEQHHSKSVRIVELNAAGVPSVEVVPLGVGRPLKTLEGPLDDLLRDPRHEPFRGAWLRIVLTDDSLPIQAMARLRQRFPHVAELRHQPPESSSASVSHRHQQVREALSPLDLSLAFFADQQGRSATEPEAEMLRRALAAGSLGAER